MPKNAQTTAQLHSFHISQESSPIPQFKSINQEMGIPEHLTCLLRNLYAGQETTVRTGLGTTDWFQIGKEVCQGCISSPCLFNLYAEYIMRNVHWMKRNLESRLLGEMSVTSDTQIPSPLHQKVKRNYRASG